MSSSGISVGTSVDVAKLVDAVDQAVARARDATAFFRTVVEPDMTALLLEQFASDGSRMRKGHRWAALKPSTIASKIRRGSNNGILRDSLEMMNAFVNPRHPDAVAIVQRLRYIRSVQGRAKELADWHKTGTPRMQARPVMGDGVPAPILRAWSGQLARYLATGQLPARSAVRG